MRNHFVLKLLLGIVAVLFLVPTLFEKILLLFFVGTIPFTNYSLPPTAMLIFYAILFAIGVYALSRVTATAHNPVHIDTKERDRARKKIIAKTTPAPRRAQTAPAKKRYSVAAEH